MRNLAILIIIMVFLSSCSTVAPDSATYAGEAKPTEAGAVSTATTIPAQTATAAVLTATLTPTQTLLTAQDGKCSLAPFITPTIAATIPAYTKLDETTGLHMTGTAQVIDLETYRLKVSGKVEKPLTLALDDLRCMPKITATSNLPCYGIFNDSGTWSGVPMKYVLEQAGVFAEAKNVVLTSADGFVIQLRIEDALDDKNFLAYEMEGKPLPILHGFPLRAVFPNEPGSRWVKWLVEIAIE